MGVNLEWEENKSRNTKWYCKNYVWGNLSRFNRDLNKNEDIKFASNLQNKSKNYIWDLGRNKVRRTTKVAISLAWPTLWSWIWTCLKHVLDGPWHGWGHHVFHCQWLLPSHRGQTVYVMMGTVWADCDVSMNYVNGLETGEGTPWTSKSVIRNQSKILLMDTMCNVNHTIFR